MKQVNPTNRLMHLKAFGDSRRIYCWGGKLLWDVGSSGITVGAFNIFRYLPVVDAEWGEGDLIILNILKEVQYGTT